MPKGTLSKQVHIVNWEVDTYIQDGKEECDWEMDSQHPLDQVMSNYISDCAENEDTGLTTLEIERLLDFVKYCQNRAE